MWGGKLVVNTEGLLLMPLLTRYLTNTGVIGWMLAVLASPSLGDTFYLASGGRVEGEWINREEQPLSEYVIRTSAGLTVKLQPSQVREHVRPLASEMQYERIAPTIPDTVEGHWKMAEWCRQQRLTAQREQHLGRILELDSNHQRARAALGYAFIEGQWVTQEGFKRQEGYEFYRGRWRRPQEIELLENRAKRELLQKEWFTKLQRWRKQLDSEHARAALESYRAIKDPLAVKPLCDLFRRERVRSVKTLYADVLANINTGDSIGFLVQASLNDPDVEVFYFCLDKLVALQVPRLADNYIDALRDANNERVNRAAAALMRIGDRAALSPLIDALVTVHQRTLPGKLGPDATAATFSADGSSSFTQNDSPQVQIIRVQNQQVLDALTTLSGGSTFGFDQKAWRYWYHQEKQAEARKGTSTLSRQE